MSHPVLYDKRETNFFSLGLGVLTDALTCVVTEERNGVFYLEMTYPIAGKRFELLENDRIIKADAGHAASSKGQRFRIKRIVKNDDGIADIYAEHVSYLSQELPIQPIFNILNQSGHTVLNTWRHAIIGSHPFTSSSNISTLNNTSLTIQDYDHPRQILGGITGSILDVWGGEYRFDNYHISLLNQRGGHANTLIAYGRNLTDLEQEDNITRTFTSVYPFAIYRNSDLGPDHEEIITIPGFVVDSAHVNAFPNRRVLPIDFSSEFESGERPAADKLRALAEQYVRDNEVGVPRVSIALRFVDLTKTLEHAGSRYEELNLCDTVPVHFEKLGIRTRAQIVRIEWDVLLDQYQQLEIGETRPTLGGTLRNIEREVNNVNNTVNYALTAANGRNTVFFGPGEPRANRVGDLWFRPNGDETEMLQWTGYAWEFILTTAPDTRVLDEVERVEREGEAAWELAQAAMAKGNEAFKEAQQALADAQLAFDTAEPLIRITDDLSGRLTTVTALAQGLQTAVVNHYAQTQTRFTQLDHQISLRVTSAQFSSAVTQLSNQIDLRVTHANFNSQIQLLQNNINLSAQNLRTNVVSYINISPGHIRIHGRLIHLTGQTLIDNAVIRDAHIADLRAEKLTVNSTLNAASVNVVNLNANNITTGFLNAVRIQAGSITANHLAANAITVGFNSLGNTLRLSSTALTFYTGGTRAGMLTGTGIQYWWGNRDIGRIMHNHIVNRPNTRGLSFGLRHTGDYLALGFMNTVHDTVYSNSLLIDPWGRWSGVNGQSRPGVHVLQRLNAHLIGTQGFSRNQNGIFGLLTINGQDCFYIGSPNWHNGLAFNNNNVFLLAGNRAYGIQNLRN